MNAERLHAIVKALSNEMEGRKLVSLMQNLVSGLRSVVQQSNAGTQQNLSSNLSNIYASLANSAVDRFSPSWKQTLREIGGKGFFGEALKVEIESILARNQMTPSVAAGELDKIRDQMESFRDALKESLASSKAFKIGDEQLSPGECEIGMLIPRGAVHNQLVDFANELKDLSMILNTFSEVATGHPDALKIKNISSSDLLVYVNAFPPHAACLALAIERVVALYKNLLEIRKLQTELQKQGVPDKVSKGLDDHANTIMGEGIEKLSNEIIKDFHKGKDPGRRNELTNAVRLSLNKIANRIDQGYNIEVRCAPLTPVAKVDEETKRAISTIEAATENMQFLNLEGKPILRLPEAAEPKKDLKKKTHAQRAAAPSSEGPAPTGKS